MAGQWDPCWLASQRELAASIPLDDPSDDDGAIACVFGANDEFVYTSHFDSGTVTRLRLPTGLVEASAAVGANAEFLELRPGVSQLVALNNVAGEVVLLAAPGLATCPAPEPKANRRPSEPLSAVAGAPGRAG